MTIVTILYGGCAALYALLAGLILIQARLSRVGVLLAAVCAIMALWAATVAALPAIRLLGVARDLDLAQALAWYGFTLHLYRRSLPSRDYGSIFTFLGWATLAGTLLLMLFGHDVAGRGGASAETIFLAGIGFRLGLGICKLLLLENLYLNTPPDRRWHVNLICVAIGGLAVYEILLAADALLTRSITPALFYGRPVIAAIVAPLLAVAAARNRQWQVNIHLSRAAAFQSATLIISGIFLIGLAGAGEVLRHANPGWGGVAEVSLSFGGIIVLMVLLTSASARSALRSLVIDHFFTHRYDYRLEWQRCIETLSSGEEEPLHLRAIRSLAQVVDSPGGVLFLRDKAEGGAFEWAGSWNMPATSQPVMEDHPLIARFQAGLQQAGLHSGGTAVECRADDARIVEGIPEIWLAAPLAHRGGLIGFVLLAPPRFSFTLDGEVFELLRIVGGEVAAYISEQRAARVLLELRQLHEYGKRFAFVAHDIKNVSSQLSLLLSNAEVHLQNPEFQHDMLATVRASVQKIGTLLRRLQSPESGPGHSLVIPAERMTEIAASFRQTRGANLLIEQDGRTAAVLMEPAAFDAVITHVLNNALEASDGSEAVQIRLRHEPRRLSIDISDRGPGMSPEFIRDELFQPFRTSKREGSGIGAFQARELLRAAGGDMLVISQPGVGTTMRLLLPAAAAALPPAVAPPAPAASLSTENYAEDLIEDGTA